MLIAPFDMREPLLVARPYIFNDVGLVPRLVSKGMQATSEHGAFKNYLLIYFSYYHLHTSPDSNAGLFSDAQKKHNMRNKQKITNACQISYCT